MPDDVAADHSSAGGLSQGCAAVSHSSGLLGPLDQLHRVDSPSQANLLRRVAQALPLVQAVEQGSRQHGQIAPHSNSAAGQTLPAGQP